jgi:nicotinamide mononucleotide transporter
VNAVSVALFAYKALYLTALLYVIFFALAVWGWIGWRQRFHAAK